MANTGLFSLTFHAAKNLISCDSNGMSDPQVVLSGPGLKKKWKSAVKYKCLNPVWEETYQSSIELPATFEFSIRDVDTFNNPFKADFMGKGTITISEKDKEVSVAPFWLKLEDKEKGGKKPKDYGEIKISYSVASTLKKDASKTFPPKHPSDLSTVGRDTSKLMTLSIFKVLQRKNAAGLLEFLKNAKPKDVNIVDADGQSPLHVACLDYAKRIPEYITMLLDFDGIDVNIRNNSQNTPLHYFCQKWDEHTTCGEHLDKFVLIRRADVNAKNTNGETPIFRAIGNNKVRGILMKYLFAHGADPHIITESTGQSLLHWASREGRLDLVELILDYSTDVDIKDKYNKTPLDMVDQYKMSYENRDYKEIQSKLTRVRELFKFLDANDLGELKQSLRSEELYLDTLCDMYSEKTEGNEVLKLTQFKVGTRHKLSTAIKNYKSNMNTMQQPTKNAAQNRADEKMDKLLSDLKTGTAEGSFIVIDPTNSNTQLEYAEVLGKGGAGTVWKGVLTHENQALPVAIKELIEGIAEDELEAFKAEFQILNNIRHVNVVRLIGLAVKPRLAMVMELCTHGSMMDVLKRKDFAFGWDRFFSMLIDTINGIERLHSNTPQLLHRDLKTLNLLVTKNEVNQLQVRVADFGLASKNTHSKSDVLKEMQGTPFYMPPEMTVGAKYSIYSDVYSLAIIIWEMAYRVCCGKYSVPYTDEEFSGPLGAFTLMMRVGQGLRPQLPDTIPVGLVKIIEKAWDADPNGRYDVPALLVAVTSLHEQYLKDKPIWESCEIARIKGGD